MASTAARPWSCDAPTTAKKMSVDSTREIAADHQRVGEIGHALDEADQEGVGEAGADQRPGDGAEGAPAAWRAASAMLPPGSALTPCSTPSSTSIGDRREGQHLRDGDARHAVDPAAARDVEEVAEPHGDDAGAAEQQDQRQADDEGRRDDRQHRQHPQQRLHRQARAQRDQREGEAEQRGEHADQRRPAPRCSMPRRSCGRRRGSRGSRSSG